MTRRKLEVLEPIRRYDGVGTMLFVECPHCFEAYDPHESKRIYGRSDACGGCFDRHDIPPRPTQGEQEDDNG
jgi:hypothetical protein